ncbi:hypothetical protein ACFUGD_21530 [Streptomyces sp. NPDC057217]|uniref:hypothetical protein n=1 Tax=unclassified Streptomyces TaxID=2593676 RepID=UPI00363CE340
MRTMSRAVTALAGTAALAALAFGAVAVVHAGGSAPGTVVSAEPDWGTPPALTGPAGAREPDWG